MPRYLVERTFPDGLDIPAGAAGARVLRSMIACNSDRDVTWIHSYVSVDRHTTHCIYDAPNPEAIRLTARANGLPVDRILEVTVLDPYPFHTGEGGATTTVDLGVVSRDIGNSPDVTRCGGAYVGDRPE